MAILGNATFLLDANLSPKVAKQLSRVCGLDVASLHGQRLGELDDFSIIELARAQRRVIITLDRDFVAIFEALPWPRRVGTIDLDLPQRLRYTRDIVRILTAFFSKQAETIDLERSMVIITEHEVAIHGLASPN